MSVRTPGVGIDQRHAAAAGSLLLILTPAACGGSAAPTSAPSVALPTTTTPSIASVAPSARPTLSASPTAAPSLTALTLLWQKGGPTPSKPWTWQPTIDPATGNIWVAVSFDSIYWIFSPDGRYLESWGTPGIGPGQLALATHEQSPSPFGSIAFAPDGGFYVADIGNNRVERFDRNRKFVATIGGFGHASGHFTRPLGIHTDGTTLYVSDDDQENIQSFDMTGTWLRTFSWGDAFLALDPAGRIVSVTGTADQATAVVVLDPVTGKTVETFPFPRIVGQALGLATDAAGDIFVTIAQPDNAPDVPVATIELDPHGKAIGTWSTAGETLAVVPDGSAIYMGGSWAFIRKYALPKP
jgi:DNA-binding beta-propeller fold protein YncE